MFIGGGGLNIVLAFQLRFEPDEADNHYDIEIQLDERPIVRGQVFVGQLPPEAPDGLLLVAPHVVPLGQIQIERDGIHMLALRVGGEELQAFPFSVVPFEQ